MVVTKPRTRKSGKRKKNEKSAENLILFSKSFKIISYDQNV